MPPRFNFHSASRSLTIRPRTIVAPRNPAFFTIIPAARRGFAEEKQPPRTGSNEDVAGHVSEEARDMAEITGETPPDMGKSTNVQEILKRDQEGKDKAPEVIKEDIKDASSASALSQDISFANLLALGRLGHLENGANPNDLTIDGHKFGLPELPIPSDHNMKHREDPVVSQVTNMIMQHGKKSVAQRNMSYILNHLRTASPPTPNPAKPLLPGTPPASHLPLNPVLYLTTAIDSIAPLLRIRSQKGAAGGGASLQIPVPLGIRQRRRQAIKWIIDAASKKKSRSSGRGMFAQRVAEEVISVVEGKSQLWDKRILVHKTGTSARANLTFYSRKKR
ncbi:hypothetical protein SBOR_4916 [Sclerotinia borealis F-4128]|uniref:Small ribosomal subunit protein uS7m n=1 Tax=Sclerotinia borealis (strain F-4128) TaxID=1432307 RepID=W9CJF7_SCLBF|nr:hypothetical protein SBOR_4916 [Sclerotinia borealis F-4128]